jgi:hypothetical protein
MHSNDTEVPRGIMVELRAALGAFRQMSRVMISGSSCSCWSRCWSRCSSACRPWGHGLRPWSLEVADRSNGLHRRC